MENLITTAQAAQILGVSPAALEKWRNRKLFGCPFFSADIKRGKKWYYDRERVEQLAAVYQKGVLANLVKLAKNTANTFLHDGQFVNSTATGGKKNIYRDKPRTSWLLCRDRCCENF